MSRKAPSIPPPALDSLKDVELGMITQVRKYELITPLFGGGVEPATADPVTVIRGSSIRGQLRFWWRACRSAGFDSLSEMSTQEGNLWGNTDTSSLVVIDVTVEEGKTGKPEPAFRVDLNHKNKLDVIPSEKIAPYAAFPLLPEEQEKRKRGWQSENVRHNVEFSLTLRYPQRIESDVNAALWAWETFGGIGARTRRGFGAIRLLTIGDKTHSLPARTDELERQIRNKLKQHVIVGPHNPEVPKLHPDMPLKLLNGSTPLVAWKQLLDRLLRFRQERYKKFGKSKWPEANEIRRRAELPPRLADEQTLNDLVEKFPRAVFGLPIVFHMPHDPSLKELTLTLQGVNKIQRLSSPLILRPLACGEGKAVGLALILNTPRIPLGGLSLDGLPASDPQPSAKLTLAEAKKINPLKADPDVLHVFLNSL
jgi:CRISPR-associated protein Cmr1